VLILARRVGESIVIDGAVEVTVLEVGRNGQVRLGVEAPRTHQVYRKELFLEIEAENRVAAHADDRAACALDLLGALGTGGLAGSGKTQHTPCDQPQGG
jgi:carbon storage regulator